MSTQDPSDTKLFDPEIRGLVKELNQRGYRTTSSCAGHKGLQRGYIAFDKVYPKNHQENIKQTCSAAGCRYIKMEVPDQLPEDKTPKSHYATFSPRGQPKEKWFGKEKPRSKEFWANYYLNNQGRD